MGAWKQFTTKDVTVTPFTVNKGFTFTGYAITGSDVGINIYEGRDLPYNSPVNLQSGFEYSSSLNSIYNSAKQLYYSNYLTSSRGDFVATASVIPGVTREDDRYAGPVNSPLYDNYLQSSLLQERSFPTGSFITTLSIPSKLYGEKIVPGTFEFTTGTGGGLFQLKDDGEGNIISGSTDAVVGQIFYSHGTVILTDQTRALNLTGYFTNLTPSILENTTFTFSSSLTIYEQQYKCTVLENEFGHSTNPSLLTQSIEDTDSQFYYPFATASYFEPYITCVGLYNGAKELVAVGKLSFPLPVSQFTDTTVVVNFDV